MHPQYNSHQWEHDPEQPQTTNYNLGLYHDKSQTQPTKQAPTKSTTTRTQHKVHNKQWNRQRNLCARCPIYNL